MNQYPENRYDVYELKIVATKLWNEMGYHSIYNINYALEKALLQGSQDAEYLIKLLVYLQNIAGDQAQSINPHEDATGRQPT